VTILCVAFSSTFTMSNEEAHAFDFTAVADSDVTLRPSDFKEGLQAHRCILSIASPIFAGMFALPRAADGSLPLPEVDLAETRAIVEFILRFIYPVTKPVIASLDELVPILAAALKYEIHTLVHDLRKLLVSPSMLAATSALRVYAIADRFGFEGEREAASRASVGSSVISIPFSDDLEHITGTAYHRFLLKQSMRRQNISSGVSSYALPWGVECYSCKISAKKGAVANPCTWWTDYVSRVKGELAKSAPADVFSPDFVQQSTGCNQCPKSQLKALPYLSLLKAELEAKPCDV
jgi:hypothetical protein